MSTLQSQAEVRLHLLRPDNGSGLAGVPTLLFARSSPGSGASCQGEMGEEPIRQTLEVLGDTPVRSSLISPDVIAKVARYALSISGPAAPIIFQLSIYRESF